jgi:hypothetical protein
MDKAHGQEVWASKDFIETVGLEEAAKVWIRQRGKLIRVTECKDGSANHDPLYSHPENEAHLYIKWEQNNG